jgi:fucose permease
VFLIMLYLIMGVITGMLDVAMNAQGVMVEKAYKKPIMTSFHAFFSIGMALGAWCGALFAGSELELYHHFAIAGFLSLVAALWVRNAFIDDSAEVKKTTAGPLFRLPTPALFGVGIITFCCMLGEGSMANWSVKYMETIVHSSQTLAPIALSAFATAMTLGRIVGDRVRSAIGDGSLIVIGGVLATVGLGVALLFPEAYLVIFGCFCVGLGLSTIVPVTYSIAGNTREIPSGVGIAMVTTVGYSGFLLGPPVIGFIADAKDLRFGLAIVAVLLLIMTILGMMLRRSGTGART